MKNWSKYFRNGNAIYQLDVLSSAAIESFQPDFVRIVGLDIRAIRLLRLIGDVPGITFAELVAYGSLERSLTSRTIQALVKAGHVERRNDAQDARRFGLYMTPQGVAVRARADRLSEAGLDLLFRPLTPAEVTAFTETMTKLAVWMDSDAYETLARATLDGMSAASPGAPGKDRAGD